MKKIEALIRPEKLNKLTEKLKAMGLKELNTVEFASYNLEKDKRVVKTKIEFVINYSEADKFIDAIKNTVYTGESGDGKIFVSDVEVSVKISTGKEVKAL
ncbi:P-II family nitrogen regulator [Halanaerobium sp. Z-7514]|uniref:P-II family nitrogen regulator n=1 Tax=Halanaerobium polyolivorans TaxID=2886943 RepID=A0AAW4X2C8_9FIRM|nr:P-II family nitrogen regulator [Halanaerobium polyolivorans]MCC3146002.1 P-II family nitrogen regulator [Halanaerobium polyolivorans]RQD77325.1 MAG: P-II family nitrogen regulator [Halanaerobium sp. MSAO_Bac5]